MHLDTFSDRVEPLQVVLVLLHACDMDTHRFSKIAAESLREAIQDAGGREVLAIGRQGEPGIVSEISIAARGGHTSVPAIRHFMEQGDIVIHNHPSGSLGPSSADLAVASDLGAMGIGFFIINNTATETYVVAEPVEKRQLKKLVLDEVVSHLLPGGALSKSVEFYEARDSQIDMLEAVVKAFNEDGILVVEAGTGVGKSLAYLLPACRWVADNKERVVISTATINLQQQLIEKDIPLIEKILKRKITSALVKGRRNYLCLRRLHEAVEENILFRESDDELASMEKWAESSHSGTKSDISPIPSEKAWSRVCSEADSCTGLRCVYRADCFVLMARREAAAANVLIVNHHLLFSDLAIRSAGAGYDVTAVLPPYHRIIFDEAHNIEKNATSFFSSGLNKYAVGRALGMLYRELKNRKTGLSIALVRILGPTPVLDSFPGLVRQTHDAANKLDKIALGWEQGKTCRFSVGDREPTPFEEEISALMEELRRGIADLSHRLNGILERYDEEDEPDEIISAKIAARRLESIALFCGSFQSHRENPDSVYWFEKSKTSAGELFAEFKVTPLDVAEILKDSVFSRFKTVVCTSATLAVKEDFTHWLRSCGLYSHEKSPVNSISLASPFPYEDRVLIAVPTDAPDPNEQDYQTFISAFIKDALITSEGKGLVLFTSYHMLSQTYKAVCDDLSNSGIRTLVQGSDDRSRLLSMFASDTNSALFATDSFWEGVDTPGESLRVVIICRLPFRVPSDPVLEAKHERIVSKGGNPFGELSLPEAAIKLKQGFGRLMRRSTDSGVVIITDPRIIKKWYGEAFLGTLPQTKRSFGPTANILHDIERFLYP